MAAGSCTPAAAAKHNPHHDAHPFRRHSLLSIGSPPYGSTAEGNMHWHKLITGDGIPWASLGTGIGGCFDVCFVFEYQKANTTLSPTQALVVGDLRRCPIMAVPCPQSTPTCSSWSSELGHRVVRASNDAVTRAGLRTLQPDLSGRESRSTSLQVSSLCAVPAASGNVALVLEHSSC